MIVNIDFSQEIFAIDMLRALKSSLKHRRKHVLRPSAIWRLGLREMFQQPLLQKLIVSESDNISDDNNSDNEPDNEDLHNSAVLKGLKLPRSK